MAPVIKALLLKYPGVQIRVLEATHGTAYNLLAGNEVDLAVVLQSANSPRLVMRELLTDELFIAAAPDHPIVRQKIVPRSALREAEFVAPATHSGFGPF